MDRSKPVTLNRHIAEAQRWHPEATGTFTRLLWDLSLASRLVSREVNMAGLVDVVGETDGVNATGDIQQKLDLLAEDRFRDLGEGGYLCALASEEQREIIPIPEGYPCGDYVFVFDPLDGSSNIDVNASLGTVFGIYRRLDGTGPGTLRDILQPGKNLICAGYVVYGSSTMLVYSTGHGVHGFTLDPSIGEFLLSHPDIKMPSRGSIYSVNEGNQHKWDEATRRYVEWVRGPDEASGKSAYSLRYIGTMVADFHRTLLRGGVFLYPDDHTDPEKPRSKLRLLYEVNPIAWLAEQAGGRALARRRRVLDIEPSALHQRVPLAVGSRYEMDRFEAMCATAVVTS